MYLFIYISPSPSAGPEKGPGRGAFGRPPEVPAPVPHHPPPPPNDNNNNNNVL